MSNAPERRKTPACPVCGVFRMEPRPHVPSTPWDDRCGCNDMETCWGHRNGIKDWPVPDRPDDATMLRRAEERAKRDHVRWDEQVAKFNEVERLRQRVERAERLAEEHEAKAKAAPLGETFVGGRFHGCSVYNHHIAIAEALRAALREGEGTP